ncbi:MAG: nucleotidyltransferase family protein [Dokdonella sp.]
MHADDANAGCAAIGHGAILLAAGASRRLGHAKQFIDIEGEPLLRRVARAMLASVPFELIVVLGHDASRMRDVVADLPLRCVVAANHAEGMSASLCIGISELDKRCGGALVALTDQPALDATHLLALRNAWRDAPERAVASAYAGVLGVPALLPRGWFAEIAHLRGDVGARELLRTRSRDVIAIAAPLLARDLDTPADLR